MALTRVLGIDAIAAIIADVGIDGFLDELIERLETVLRGYDPALIPTVDRGGFHYTEPALGLIEWMPAMTAGRWVSMKMVGYHPTNPTRRGIPTVQATISLHDTTTGELVALTEGTTLTALRTGAASAVASKVLAVPELEVVGVVGCGAQAVTQLHALSRVRAFDRVLAFDINPEVSSSLERRLPIDTVRVDVVAADQLATLMAVSDVIVTCTSVEPGAGPVLPEAEPRPWLHINAVGADFPGKTEIPRRLLDTALVCPDRVSQCLVEGECQVLAASSLGPDLVRLVKEADRYAAHRDSLTVFDSTGWALEDLVVAEMAFEHADRLGVGSAIDLNATPRDPYDPYQIVLPDRGDIRSGREHTLPSSSEDSRCISALL
jgi:L-lysine cyclodeaminase